MATEKEEEDATEVREEKWCEKGQEKGQEKEEVANLIEELKKVRIDQCPLDLLMCMETGGNQGSTAESLSLVSESRVWGCYMRVTGRLTLQREWTYTDSQF